MDVARFLQAGETADDLLKGRLKVIQKEQGYRFSLDALLLAHFVRLHPRDAVIDLGTGSGVIPLILSQRDPSVTFMGVEIQETLVEMAGRSVAMNGLTDRIEIRQGDLREVIEMAPPQSFQVVIFNPPYRRRHTGRVNPDAEKALARHEIAGGLRDFLAAATFLLERKGRVYIIYPAVRLVELLSRMRLGRLEPKRLQMVYSRAGGEGTFVLVEGLKGGNETLKVLPPLVIYEGSGGVYTEAMARLFRDLCGPPGSGGAGAPLP